ncbi:antibiotic biosynthesis monooxygenase [Caulobacter sp. 602-2]|uniref:Antibiotic biosynthesis monooxygenase n=1 Tax=Caulobacter sp. 602-2 TaxID=2710887 RepID=A0A6G4QSC5_9CAUL|nr:putative quinol monooxygenase [Caulobacter sp. 602-2]NGM48339.1 antibiotic biosynthesis monooxygenase [Caulobacter sp. 602-2]
MRKTITTLLAVTVLTAVGAGASPTLAREPSGVRYEQIPAGAYSIVAQVQAKPGQEAALRAATLPLVELVRGDPKNLVYFLQEDRAKPGHFVFYEIFATKEDFEAHNAMPYVKDWFAKLPTLAEGGVQVMRMEVLGREPR